MNTWHNKAKQIIGAMCNQSRIQSNTLPSGKLRKRHVPYSVPAAASMLIDCLNRDDEETAKSLMAHNYDIQQIRNSERL